jgi:hypothetical protein
MYSPPRVSSSGLVVFAILHHVATFLYLGASVAMVFMNHSDDQLLCSLLAALFWIPMVTFDSLILHRGWSAVQARRSVWASFRSSASIGTLSPITA